jgi:hypothetical protein
MTTTDANITYQNWCKNCKHNKGISHFFINCFAKETLVFLNFDKCEYFDYPDDLSLKIRKKLLQANKIEVK